MTDTTPCGLDLDELDEDAVHLDHGQLVRIVGRLTTELRQARARVEELETCLSGLHASLGPRPFHLPEAPLTEIVRWQLDSTLRALKHETDEHDRHHQVEEQQAARIAQLESELAERKAHETAAILEMAKARGERMDAESRGMLNAWLAHDFETEHEGLVKRLWDKSKELHARNSELESELATLREEAELERLVRATLKERNDSLFLRYATPWWKAEWLGTRPGHHGTAVNRASAATLPALLRAILAVEKGGSGG